MTEAAPIVLKAQDPDENGVRVHRRDTVYYRHVDGNLREGTIKSVGRDGFTAECEGALHRVLHRDYVGHKVRAPAAAKLISHGEDGALAELEDGRQVFLKYPEEEEEEDELGKALIFLKAKKVKDGPGNSLQIVTTKAGKTAHRWKHTAPDAGAGGGYGTHNLERGDTIHYEHEGAKHAGRITHADAKGAKVRNAHGADHDIGWHQVRGHMAEAAKPALAPDVKGDQAPIPAADFDAAKYAAGHDDANVTPDSVLSKFPPEVRQLIAQVQERLASIEQTIDTVKKDGKYLPGRLAKHREIVDHYLNASRVEAARPAEGTVPTFTVLGGRGGSGKSWFKGKVYDPDRAIVLDCDEIKGMLPEYEGWNAAQVHEEASELFEQITDTAKQLGLNIVHDATMKTKNKAVDLVKQFKDAGYATEAHYLHLPRQEAAKRAVARFMGKTARYVPVEVILGNRSNEESFDAVRNLVDAWSFRDNNVPAGKPPKLISYEGHQPLEERVMKSYPNGGILFVRQTP